MPPLADLMPGDNDGNYEIPTGGLLGPVINEGIDRVSGGSGGTDNDLPMDDGVPDGAGDSNPNNGVDDPNFPDTGDSSGGGIPNPFPDVLPSDYNIGLGSGGNSGSDSGGLIDFSPVANSIQSVGQTAVLAVAGVVVALIVSRSSEGQSDG